MERGRKGTSELFLKEASLRGIYSSWIRGICVEKTQEGGAASDEEEQRERRNGDNRKAPIVPVRRV